MRIKLEPLMTLARSFPTAEQRTSCETWEPSEDLTESLSRAESALASLVSHSESAWASSWPHGRDAVGSGEDSEISEDDEDTAEKSNGAVPSDDRFDEWRGAVLNHWGRKVSDASGEMPKDGFKAFDTSITGQMRGALRSGKYVERTRRVREEMTLLGGVEVGVGTHDFHFDDGELYRVLLREIIEGGDASGGGLRYAQLSKGGNMKKKRDQTFAKGKRLKYDVHDKLIGFLAPVPLPDPGPLDEIVTNLFGGAGRKV